VECDSICWEWDALVYACDCLQWDGVAEIPILSPKFTEFNGFWVLNAVCECILSRNSTCIELNINRIPMLEEYWNQKLNVSVDITIHKLRYPKVNSTRVELYNIKVPHVILTWLIFNSNRVKSPANIGNREDRNIDYYATILMLNRPLHEFNLEGHSIEIVLTSLSFNVCLENEVVMSITNHSNSTRYELNWGIQ